MKKYRILSILFLLFSLAGVLYLVKNNQDIRDRANNGEYNGGSLCGGNINNWCSQNGITATKYTCPNEWNPSCGKQEQVVRDGSSLCLERDFCGSQQLDVYYVGGGSCWIDYWDYSCDVTPTNTPVPPTNTPTPTNTPVPTATNTPMPTATNTPVPTATGTPQPTNTPKPTATNTPMPTATNTPMPTATPTSKPNTCGGTCGSNSNCQSDYVCYQGYCRNPSCTSSPDCICPGEPNLCGGTCGSNTNCKSNLFCSEGFCRNPSCPGQVNCICQASPVPTKVIAEGPSPTRIILLESGVEFPSQILTLVGGIITLLGFLILL